MNKLNITIVASGPRYRSSLQASVLETCGAFGGDGTRITGPANPNGFYENMVIKRLCVIPYINRFQPGKKSLPGRTKHIDARHAKIPFIDEHFFYHPPHFRERVLEILRRQGWDGRQPLYYKLPLATLMCNVWHRAFPEAKWIVLSRDWKSVRDSMIRQKWMSPIPEGREEQHGREYIAMYEKSIEALTAQPDVEWRPADMEKFMAGDLSEQQELIEWCGLEWDQEAVAGLIEK